LCWATCFATGLAEVLRKTLFFLNASKPFNVGLVDNEEQNKNLTDTVLSSLQRCSFLRPHCLCAADCIAFTFVLAFPLFSFMRRNNFPYFFSSLPSPAPADCDSVSSNL
jgi:hypothetical protein